MADAMQELMLTIEPGSNPIAGRLCLPGGPSTSFEGYVELIAALEQVRERADPGREQPGLSGMEP